MNPELEARLRRLGARVDAAAEEAAARHRVVPLKPPTAGERPAIVPDLEPVVVAFRRPSRLYRVLAVSAAAAGVAVALGVVIGRSAQDESDRPFASGTELAAVATSEPAPTTTEPRSTVRPVTTVAAPASTSTSPPSTTTAAPEVDDRDTTEPRVCPSYRVNESLPLRLCDRGDLVRQVQQRLSETVATSLLADGFFGPATQAAVREFQQQQGLEVDGLVGPATVTALFAGATASAEV
jgi:putative peptidoglycan binding protein